MESASRHAELVSASGDAQGNDGHRILKRVQGDDCGIRQYVAICGGKGLRLGDRNGTGNSKMNIGTSKNRIKRRPTVSFRLGVFRVSLPIPMIVGVAAAVIAGAIWLHGMWAANEATATVPGGSLAQSTAEQDPIPAKVNINTADADALQILPGIGSVIAERIVAYRDEHGAFAAVEDLKNVSGIGDAKLKEIAPLATI